MKLHHIGLVVKDIEISAKHYEDVFGMERMSRITFDPNQKVKVLFMAHKGIDLKYELIEPAGSESPAFQWLKKRVSMYHLCYVVRDIEKTVQELTEKGCLLISKPISAKAFNEKKIAFLLTSENLIIELLEQ